jgi:NAD-dependent SIR2 family protein deacetylase
LTPTEINEIGRAALLEWSYPYNISTSVAFPRNAHRKLLIANNYRNQLGASRATHRHRLNLYRDTVPHHGFQILQRWADQLPYGAFVFTSNVDGQFQKSGIDPLRMLECHGSIHHLQCTRGCGKRTWPVGAFNPTIDTDHCRIISPLPTCPNCGSVARPNILMFNDFNWLSNRKTEQQMRFIRWRERVESPVVIELGAGTAIPSVRRFGEGQHCPLIRINPREPEVERSSDVSLALGALAGLSAIDEMLI